MAVADNLSAAPSSTPAPLGEFHVILYDHNIIAALGQAHRETAVLGVGGFSMPSQKSLVSVLKW